MAGASGIGRQRRNDRLTFIWRRSRLFYEFFRRQGALSREIQD